MIHELFRRHDRDAARVTLTRMHQQRIAARELEGMRQARRDDAEHFLDAERAAGALQQRRHLARDTRRHALLALAQPRDQPRRELAEMHRRLDHVGGAGGERIGGVFRIGDREQQHQRHRRTDARLCLGEPTLEAGAVGQQRHERERRGSLVLETHGIGRLEHHEAGARQARARGRRDEPRRRPRAARADAPIRTEAWCPSGMEPGMTGKTTSAWALT